MAKKNDLEAWLQGPLPEVPSLLQPVAHALLQAQKEVNTLLQEFPEALLWHQPAGLASVGFHLQHLAGVIDRLFTYAREEMLSETQLTSLAAEGKPNGEMITLNSLLQTFNKQVEKAINQLINTDSVQLTEVREVGRNRLPSTLLGLLFHAAEHTMRHLGQLLVTVRIL